MTGWLGTVAFVLVVVELVFGAAAVLAARRFWRKVEPTVRPMLAMFTPPASSSSSPNVVDAPDEK